MDGKEFSPFFISGYKSLRGMNIGFDLSTQIMQTYEENKQLLFDSPNPAQDLQVLIGEKIKGLDDILVKEGIDTTQFATDIYPTIKQIQQNTMSKLTADLAKHRRTQMKAEFNTVVSNILASTSNATWWDNKEIIKTNLMYAQKAAKEAGLLSNKDINEALRDQFIAAAVSTGDTSILDLADEIGEGAWNLGGQYAKIFEEAKIKIDNNNYIQEAHERQRREWEKEDLEDSLINALFSIFADDPRNDFTDLEKQALKIGGERALSVINSFRKAQAEGLKWTTNSDWFGDYMQVILQGRGKPEDLVNAIENHLLTPQDAIGLFRNIESVNNSGTLGRIKSEFGNEIDMTLKTFILNRDGIEVINLAETPLTNSQLIEMNQKKVNLFRLISLYEEKMKNENKPVNLFDIYENVISKFYKDISMSFTQNNPSKLEELTKEELNKRKEEAERRR